MSNRTGTYVAFDGLGEKDPTKSDLKYYSDLQAWKENQNIEFNFINSHDKTSAVQDSSSKETLHRTIQERLRMSKNVLIILTSDTRKTGSTLSYEIEQAIDVYKLPLIIAYPEHSTILDVNDALTNIWPEALVKRIDNSDIEAIHIAFKKECIFDAIKRFSVNGEHLQSGKEHYLRADYLKWGLIK
mgnify:CR=1 FL=1